MGALSYITINYNQPFHNIKQIKLHDSYYLFLQYHIMKLHIKNLINIDLLSKQNDEKPITNLKKTPKHFFA